MKRERYYLAAALVSLVAAVVWAGPPAAPGYAKSARSSEMRSMAPRTAVSVGSETIQQAPAGATYVTAVWGGPGTVHFLGADLSDLGSFAVGTTEPNGIATDGTTIYVGTFSPAGVTAYDMNGVQQFQWSSDYCMGLQGMELVNGELAVMEGNTIHFLDPSNGAWIRDIPNAGGGTVEGLAYDGTLLWELGNSVIGVNPSTGAAVVTLPNAAIDCNYGGTGITWSGPGELTLACDSGTWYRVSSASGSVLATGNNGLRMMGLKRLASPPPLSYDMGFQDDYGRSTLCVNSTTGAWQWAVLKGNSAGKAYSGTGTVVNGSGYMRLTATAGSGYGLNLIYYTTAHRATATFTYRPDAVSSALYDQNTLNDTASCGGETPLPGD